MNFRRSFLSLVLVFVSMPPGTAQAAVAEPGRDFDQDLALAECELVRFVGAIDFAVAQACTLAAEHMRQQEEGAFDLAACRKQFAPLRGYALEAEMYVTGYVRRYLQNLVSVESFWRQNGLQPKGAALQACVDALQSLALRPQSSFWHRWFGSSEDGTHEASCRLSYLFPNAGAMYDDYVSMKKKFEKREQEAKKRADHHANGTENAQPDGPH